MQKYTVQKGDTIYGISKQFGVPVEDIKRENNLVTDTISIGQVLKIPTVETTSLYVVKSGDTLYQIANKYGTTVLELMSVNNLKSTVLSIGQQLRIPMNEENNIGFIIYVVKPGDTLYQIAVRYNTTVDAIRNLNNLSSNLLSIGQQLKIPTTLSTDNNEITYQNYIVKSGDTLYQIAKEYGMTVEQLKAINNLTNNNLQVGQILKVNKNVSTESSIPLGSTCYGTGYKEPTFVTYTVKRGDSLYTIAKAHNTSVENLMKLNNLTNNNLQIGQIIKIEEVR